jgi:Bacteriophage holin of superfamily 6 (Holin_LLH)
MTAAQLISTIIFFAMPGSVGAVIYICWVFKQRLPEYQAVRLEQFTRLAVQQVEQQNSKLGGAAKKQLAIASTAKLFEAFHLPAPPASAMGIAIESAVLFLPSKPKEDV